MSTTKGYLQASIFQRLEQERQNAPQGKPLLKLNKDPVLSSGEVALLYGAAKSGKTLLLLNLVAAALQGKAKWLKDLTLETDTVLYLAPQAEIAQPTIVRYMAKFGVKDDNAIKEAYFPLPDSGSQESRLDDIRQVMEALKQDGRQAIIILDSLMRFVPMLADRAAENDSTVMNMVLSPIATSARANDQAVIIIHHSGKASSNYRGSSAILGSVDHALSASFQDNASTITLKYERGRSSLGSDRKLGSLALQPTSAAKTAAAKTRPMAEVTAYLKRQGKPLPIGSVQYPHALSRAELFEAVKKGLVTINNLPQNWRNWRKRAHQPGGLAVCTSGPDEYVVIVP